MYQHFSYEFENKASGSSLKKNHYIDLLYTRIFLLEESLFKMIVSESIVLLKLQSILEESNREPLPPTRDVPALENQTL